MSRCFKYFDQSDFDRCVPPCGIDDMLVSFLSRLDIARDIAGVPFVLTSAYRSRDWELSHGRLGTSSHCFGCAVDIRCHDSVTRLKIVTALVAAGFRRIGLSGGFIHVDSDRDKPDCLWLY